MRGRFLLICVTAVLVSRSGQVLADPVELTSSIRAVAGALFYDNGNINQDLDDFDSTTDFGFWSGGVAMEDFGQNVGAGFTVVTVGNVTESQVTGFGNTEIWAAANQFGEAWSQGEIVYQIEFDVNEPIHFEFFGDLTANDGDTNTNISLFGPGGLVFGAEVSDGNDSFNMSGPLAVGSYELITEITTFVRSDAIGAVSAGAEFDFTLELIEACEGDANGDGVVDPLDSGYVLARFGCEVGIGEADCDIADQNGDGEVDPLDSGFVLARFGKCS